MAGRRSGPQHAAVARADQAPGFQPAGTYVPPFGTTAETLALGADGKFQYVYGGHRPEDRYASEGSYRLVEGMVILSPSREEGDSGVETPRRLVPIQMGRSWFLVPEERMVAFCAWFAGWPDPGDPRVRGENIVYRRDDGDLEGEPQLLPAWRAFYRGLLGRRFGRVPESPSSGAGALTRGPLPQVERPPFPLLEERDPQVPWETVDDEWFSLFAPGRTGFDFPVVARLYARRETGATVLCIQIPRAASPNRRQRALRALRLRERFRRELGERFWQRAIARDGVQAYLASPDCEWFAKGGGQRFARHLSP